MRDGDDFEEHADHRLCGREDHTSGEPQARAILKKGRIWCFTLNRRWVIDARVGGNTARFINHSCTPNCWIEIKDGVIWIRASRTIRPGEELTYDYNTSGDAMIPCRCRPAARTL